MGTVTSSKHPRKTPVVEYQWHTSIAAQRATLSFMETTVSMSFPIDTTHLQQMCESKTAISNQKLSNFQPTQTEILGISHTIDLRFSEIINSIHWSIYKYCVIYVTK